MTYVSLHIIRVEHDVQTRDTWPGLLFRSMYSLDEVIDAPYFWSMYNRAISKCGCITFQIHIKP